MLKANVLLIPRSSSLMLDSLSFGWSQSGTAWKLGQGRVLLKPPWVSFRDRVMELHLTPELSDKVSIGLEVPSSLTAPCSPCAGLSSSSLPQNVSTPNTREPHLQSASSCSTTAWYPAPAPDARSYMWLCTENWREAQLNVPRMALGTLWSLLPRPCLFWENRDTINLDAQTKHLYPQCHSFLCHRTKAVSREAFVEALKYVALGLGSWTGQCLQAVSWGAAFCGGHGG